ncbi:hypothetical protein NMY22_g5161 [Coprinellus aureogranulatus]|nr:hypothetical protein NMY22_g5161 [Coprinellus aureogranulatus]
MSIESNKHNRTRKRDRFLGLFKCPSSQHTLNTCQTLGSNGAHPSVVLESSAHIQHHGQVFNTTNTGNGPVNNVGHIENAIFQLRDSGPEALLWSSLPKQRDTSAQHNEYMEGSRDEDVRAILQWVDSASSGELALWIQGTAGIGKSTLARHLTHLLRTDKRLAASVSLSALPSDARGPESVIKIIAREMGTIHPAIIPLILSAISSCHGAPTQEAIEKYLRDPVRHLQRPWSMVFILDAIDEWEYYELLMKELPWIATSSPTLKLILLGRSDPQARGFEGAWLRPYQLAPISSATMERYFVKELGSVKWDLGRTPTQNQITKLVELANGLFIWAMVVCSLLKKRFSRSSPSETLEAILCSRRSVGAEGGLAGLYHQAILWLFPDPGDQDLLRQYLGTTLVLQEALPLNAFSSLAKLPTHVIQSVKLQLTALQIRYPVGDTHQIYPANAIFHLSFREYLLGSSTPPGISFSIPEFEYHSLLAETCLLELRDFLPKAHQLSASDLTARQKYAVKHMPTHVHQGTPSVESDSDVSWKQTTHFSLLQDITIPSLIQWGSLFVDLVQPGLSTEGIRHPGGSRGEVMADAAPRLEEGDVATLRIRISCLEVAVRLEPPNPHTWLDLGWAYNTLAKFTQSKDTFDQAVRSHQNALRAGDISADTESSQYQLYSLGTALDHRHDYFGDPQDLAEAIAVFRSALALSPPGHPHRAEPLNNLAISLSKRSTVDDLRECICLRREALELRPPGHPERGIYLNNLANSLSEAGSISDLQESISLGREALQLFPPGHPDRPEFLNSLAWLLCLSHETLGFEHDLDEAVLFARESLSLRPPGHPSRFYTLAAALCHRPQHLDEALSLSREAVSLISPGNSNYWDISMTLANILLRQYERSGALEYLEDATVVCSKAMLLCPMGDPKRPKLLTLESKLAKARSALSSRRV